jgi:hypothetical protein
MAQHMMMHADIIMELVYSEPLFGKHTYLITTHYFNFNII